MTLTEFLLARIATDESAAQKAFDTRKEWVVAYIPDVFYGVVGMSGARVLVECAAKRAIMALAATITDMAGEISGEWPRPHVAVIDGEPILRALAMPYAEHPDYDEAWRP